jgi:tRNA 2-thiouridine synthesizing protein A
MELKIDKEVDACGLKCPLPILRAKKALAELQSGQVLRILATDSSTVKDFQAFTEQTGNVLLALNRHEDIFSFLIRRR